MWTYDQLPTLNGKNIIITGACKQFGRWTALFRVLPSSMCLWLPWLTRSNIVHPTIAAGLGLASAIELAKKGATLFLCVRSKARGDEAVQKIRAATDKGVLELGIFDHANLKSVIFTLFSVCLFFSGKPHLALVVWLFRPKHWFPLLTLYLPLD